MWQAHDDEEEAAEQQDTTNNLVNKAAGQDILLAVVPLPEGVDFDRKKCNLTFARDQLLLDRTSRKRQKLSTSTNAKGRSEYGPAMMPPSSSVHVDFARKKLNLILATEEFELSRKRLLLHNVHRDVSDDED